MENEKERILSHIKKWMEMNFLCFQTAMVLKTVELKQQQLKDLVQGG